MSASILVTGGTGFLGSRLLRRLVHAGYDLLLLKRSVSSVSRIEELLPRLRTFDVDLNPLEKLFVEERPDIILHCATDYGRNGAPQSRVIETNLVFPQKLLESAIESGTRVFINTDTVLDDRVSPYASSKRQFAEQLKSRGSRLTAINIALEHFYGPGDDPSKFVARAVRDLLANTERIDLTPGEQRRDFVYIDDVVDAFMMLIARAPEMPVGFYSYQVGTGWPVSIRELMSLLVELSGNTRTRLEFGAVPYRPNEAMESKTDAEALRTLGWSPKTTLTEGLRRTIEGERVP